MEKIEGLENSGLFQGHNTLARLDFAKVLNDTFPITKKYSLYFFI